MSEPQKKNGSAIAIIGMAGRFPQAGNVAAFWVNLRNGVESLRHLTREELIAAGVDPSVADLPSYVKAGTYLENPGDFDAPFFGVNPREADVIDPQHRVFLECAWEALEDAAYNPDTYPGLIGVFGGSSMNTYAMNNLVPNRDILASVGGYQAMIGNDKDFITTRVSYKLNLRGPSVAVQTACSTSLVAVQLACQSLLGFQCDIALAGGASINFPQNCGYLYQEGMIFSPDGHVRPFDAKAGGIRAGEGVGIVVLKRLDDALRDGDHIHAVILGSAINNDGAMKVGYTAPSVDGQAEAIATAQAIAEVDPETITYVEAHGTATPLGDPIEIAALTKVFRAGTKENQFCAIGSVKSNIGHLDAAAGVAGLIKAVLALEHREIPPSLNFESANPQIDFAASPFYVSTKLSPWNARRHPRRAAVSSFGIGGTNAHVVLEEAPTPPAPSPGRPNQILVISARTASALDAATQNLTRFLAENPKIDLADLAYTHQIGRRAFEHRKMVVCRDLDDARQALESKDRRRVYTSHQEASQRPVTFLFSGQGSQYPNMGVGVYRSERVFREAIDECAELLRPHLDMDLREALYPELFPEQPSGNGNSGTDAAALLSQTWLTQPALFATEYSLAQLWMHWGVEPQSMIGHSIGEYVAACVAGVFSLSDALALVAARGKLMYDLPSGAMLAVTLPEDDLRLRLEPGVSLAAINAPTLCVASGPVAAIDALEKELEDGRVTCQRLRTSHAFHSAMMEPAVAPFVQRVAAVKPRAPRIRFVSNLTGTWITEAQAVDPQYWGTHLRGAVLFAAGMTELAKDSGRIYLEVGPGHTLKTLARQTLPGLPEEYVLSSLPHPQETQPSEVFVLNTLGRLWLAGAKVAWERLHQDAPRRRISLPGYPFERKKYFVEGRRSDGSSATTPASAIPATLTTRLPLDEWFWVNSWQRSVPLASLHSRAAADDGETWAIFLDDAGVGAALAMSLKKGGVDVVTVAPGTGYLRSSGDAFTIAPGTREDYDRLFDDIAARGGKLRRIVHLWNVSRGAAPAATFENIRPLEDLAFYSFLFLGQVLADRLPNQPIQLLIVSTGMQTIVGDDGDHPERALLLGPAKVLRQERENIQCRSIDIELPVAGSVNAEQVAGYLLAEATHDFRENISAYRGPYRWVPGVQQVRIDATSEPKKVLRAGGTYVITGGTGAIGLTLAKYMAETAKANLLLTSRSGLPPRAEWTAWVDSHDAKDAISDKIRQIQHIESLGGRVIVAAADSADEKQMRGAIALAKMEFGALHGVIHAAGISGGGIIAFNARATAERVLAPKVDGALLLEQLTEGEPLDFFVLCSSVNAIFGGIGAVDYCAACAFQDALALSRAARNRGRMISIGWDAWREAGMAVNVVVPLSVKAAREESLSYGILPDEGIQVFGRIVASGLPQTDVSTLDLRAIIDWNGIFTSKGAGPDAGSAGEAVTHDRGAGSASLSKHARPDLPGDYLAPRNEQERSLAAIWSELLGIEPIGVQDNFFDLGGHSLLATRVLSRVQELFKVRLPLRTIFEAPTIAEFAERLQAVSWALQSPVAAGGDGEGTREEIDL